jgi:hypothetical protein
MAKFTLGPYHLLVDVEGTRAYYAAHPLPWVTCGCAGCRNFVRAARLLPPEVQAFFAQLGLDPEKPAECSHDTGTPETVSTDAWYHLRGTIQAGDMPPGSYEIFSAWLPVAEGIRAAFKTACDLLPEDFSQPCFQMNILYDAMPWLLEEPNPYMEE